VAGIKNALSWSFASNYLMIMVRFASVVIVARLLTPEEIGIFSIALAGFGFLQIFRDFGVGTYIVQHRNLKPKDLAATYAVSLMICWFLALVAYFSADAIGAFYGRHEVTEIFELLVINLILIPFGTINLALIKRKRMFKHIAMIDVCSATLSSISVVIFAYNGYGYLSPALGSIVGCLTTVVISNIFRQKELPFLPSFRGIGDVFKFGSFISTSNIVTHISQTGPELIIGKTLGIEAVAFFNKGSSTAQLINRLILKSVRAVASPFFAEYHRNNINKLSVLFLKFQDYIVTTAWPFLIFIGYFSHETMFILYGPQWTTTAELLPYFCFIIAMSCPLALGNQLLVNTGHVKMQLLIVTILAVLKMLVVIFASFYSLKMTVTLMLMLPIIRIFIFIPAINRVFPMSFSLLKTSILKWLGISLCYFAFIVLFDRLLSAYVINSVYNVLSIGLGSSVLWVYLLYLFKHPLFDEIKPVMQKLVRK
jgi:O-antigen/teichoic acid export membrane protein